MPRDLPRISINKLGEYMTATAVRRRRIIREQKHPPEYQAARYTEAQEAISAFLSGGANDDTILTSAIERIRASSPKSDWDAQRIELCAEAIESFLDFPDYEFMKDMEATAAANNQPKITIASVAVSVRPEVVLRGHERAGWLAAGAVKLYIGKTHPLSAESAAYIATLLHQFAESQFSGLNVIFHKCSVVDVFSKQAFQAPRSFMRRRQDLEAGCEEIARAWPVF